MSLKESALDPAQAVLDVVVPAGEPWLGRLARGQTFRIVDLEGNQAVDTLFYDAFDLRKEDGAPNRLIERRSRRVPEHLRPKAKVDPAKPEVKAETRPEEKKTP